MAVARGTEERGVGAARPIDLDRRSPSDVFWGVVAFALVVVAVLLVAGLVWGPLGEVVSSDGAGSMPPSDPAD